mmetsp:Transcript_8557/g.25618  ORF Transcript_8557/g.25618 Transcript_8557/m.25618 type:complete len:211 (-) Transcript_8557:1615-2247(-)
MVLGLLPELFLLGLGEVDVLLGHAQLPVQLLYHLVLLVNGGLLLADLLVQRDHSALGGSELLGRPPRICFLLPQPRLRLSEGALLGIGIALNLLGSGQGGLGVLLQKPDALAVVGQGGLDLGQLRLRLLPLPLRIRHRPAPVVAHGDQLGQVVAGGLVLGVVSGQLPLQLRLLGLQGGPPPLVVHQLTADDVEVVLERLVALALGLEVGQ